MQSSGFFSAVDNGFRRVGFPDSRDVWLEYCPDLESTLVASPVQLSETLPDVEPSPLYLSPHPASSIYPPACDEHHLANFAAASPTPNAHPPLGAHGWHLPTDPHSVQDSAPFQNRAPFFNPQNSRPTSIGMPAAPQPATTPSAGSGLIHNDLQGYSYIYPPVRDEHHLANFAAVPPIPNAHTPLHVHGWHLPTDPRPVQPNAPFCSPQYPAPTSAIMPTTHQPPVTLSADGAPLHNDLQRYSYVARKSLQSTIGTCYQQIQPTVANVTLNPSSVPSDLAFQPPVRRPLLEEIPRRNSRGGRSVTSSPYRPNRTSSLPVQSVSPTETVSHICQWIRDDGIMCAAPITRASVPEHLATHGVTNMAHDHRVPCRWLGCRIRGNKDVMKRESMVRHVREKHLRCRRTL